MADDYDGWERTGKELGSGGQGTVYLARNSQAATRRREAAIAIEDHLWPFHRTRGDETDPNKVAKFAENLATLISPDPPENLGALKHFHISPKDKDEEQRAVNRLITEINALELKHPAILKLLYANPGKRFIVTEYHSAGTLATHIGRFRGNVTEALKAFRPLVDAVAKLHQHNMIHRDIKTENIFIASDGRLVLGDFGIVFFKDGHDRLTTTYEKVGTSFWMAPWAYKNERLALDQIDPTLDIFPLAKVLWSMIAGKNGFSYWRLMRNENNLEVMFPDDPMMPAINRVLQSCIAEEEEDCKLRGFGLLDEVDRLISQARRIDQKPDDGGPWLCRTCGRGQYGPIPYLITNSHVTDDAERLRIKTDRIPLAMYACNNCGNVQLFKPNR